MVAKLFQFLQHSAKHKELVGMYHASLTEQTKREIYRRFCSPTSQLCCLVATIAFGLVSLRIPVETCSEAHCLQLLRLLLFHSGTQLFPLSNSEHFAVELAGLGRMPSLVEGFVDLIALPVK